MRLSYFIRKLRTISDKRERLRFVIILLLVFSLPFDLVYSSILLILLGVMTVLDLDRQKLRSIPRQFILFQTVFLLSVAGYFYSLHKDQASFLLERQLSIFILPVILPLAVRVTWSKVRLALVSLSAGCFLALIYLFCQMGWVIFMELKMDLIPALSSGFFFNHQFSRPLGIHAGYLSLYIALSFFYILTLYNKKQRAGEKSLLVLIMLFFAAGLFFLASRNIIIGSFLIVGFLYPLFRLRHRFRHVIIVLLAFVATFLLIMNVPYLQTRFSEELISDIHPAEHNRLVDYGLAEPRIERWKAGWDLFRRSPAFGYGTGDEISMLKTEYIRRELFVSYLENYNAHNQYLSYLLKNGLFGLLIFMCVLIYYGYVAVSRRNFLYMSFLTLLVIGFYTENILDANKGIIFFSFFNTFFAYSLLRKSSVSGTAA